MKTTTMKTPIRIEIKSVEDFQPGDLFDYRYNGRFIATLTVVALNVPFDKYNTNIPSVEFTYCKGESCKKVNLAHEYFNNHFRHNKRIEVIRYND